jgi:excinuclease ABC subunit B
LNGEVILYADVKTQSIQKFLAVSEYRRERQLDYNRRHNITPRSVSRAVEESLSTVAHRNDAKATAIINDAGGDFDVTETIRELEEEMLTAANNLEFEKAALLRDQINELKRATDGLPPGTPERTPRPVSYRKSGRKARNAR